AGAGHARPGARRALRASGADGCGARAVRALRLALRTLAREWRSGELGVLLLALTVAVAALTGVGFLVSRISAAVALQASTVLAAAWAVAVCSGAGARASTASGPGSPPTRARAGGCATLPRRALRSATRCSAPGVS